MDEASAELLAYLTGELPTRPWLFGVARGGQRPPASTAPEAPDGDAGSDSSHWAQGCAPHGASRHAAEHPLPMHVLEVVEQRSGGNPQFLATCWHGDRLRRFCACPTRPKRRDGAVRRPAPEDRTVVRRAAMFRFTFHPRMLSWFADEDDGRRALPRPPWARLQEFFEEEADGYLRFRRSLLRDAAYEGLPYSSGARLHGAVAARLEDEMEQPEGGCGHPVAALPRRR